MKRGLPPALKDQEHCMKFFKYHGLGNDYLVIPPGSTDEVLPPERIRAICDRHFGVGSDGILLGPFPSRLADFRLMILNPDGSQAEKSGNGLRIFARFLYDQRQVGGDPFTVETLAGSVVCQVAEAGKRVTVEMGEVSFLSTKIPVLGEEREVLREQLEVCGKILMFCAATVGNPHCVILGEEPSPEIARQYGPLIECDSRFPNRTNVQFLKVIDRENIRIEIWERGAGYTLASGSSSTAAAAVAHRLGLCDAQLTVHMPGGKLAIQLSRNFTATMIGPVTRVCEGVIDPEMFLHWGP
jgi:diaminopimelate epimerase